MFDVITVGEATVDAFLTLVPGSIHPEEDHKGDACFRLGAKIPVEKYDFLLGGNANNVAIGLKRLGFSTTIVAETGSDELSDKIINNLKKENVDVSSVLRTPGNASFSVIINFAGERTIFNQNVKRQHNFSFENVKSKNVYLTSLGVEWRGVYENVGKFVKRAQTKLFFNPGGTQISAGRDSIKDILIEAEVIFLNYEEALEISNIKYQISNRDGMQQLAKDVQLLGPRTVVITDGANGSYALEKSGDFYFTEGAKVSVVERTGAGDAYATGFTAAVLSGEEVPEAMRWGTANAASVISQVGAQSGLLTQSEMEKKIGE